MAMSFVLWKNVRKAVISVEDKAIIEPKSAQQR